PGLRGGRRQKIVRVLGRYEDVADLEIATAGSAKTRDVPRVVNCHVLGGKVAAKWHRAFAVLQGGQSHEPAGMGGPASERPPPGNAIAAIDGLRRTDGAGCGDDERGGIGKPFASDAFGQITTGTAHAAAIRNDPAY